MRGKLLFITGGLVGYVLGARAGRKRYDQIVAAAQNLWSAPPVQRRVNEARDFALERVGDVPSALLEGGRKLEAQSIIDDLNIAMTWLSYPGRVNGSAKAQELDFSTPASAK